jgi:hypothetical protein
VIELQLCCCCAQLPTHIIILLYTPHRRCIALRCNKGTMHDDYAELCYASLSTRAEHHLLRSILRECYTHPPHTHTITRHPHPHTHKHTHTLTYSHTHTIHNTTQSRHHALTQSNNHTLTHTHLDREIDRYRERVIYTTTYTDTTTYTYPYMHTHTRTHSHNNNGCYVAHIAASLVNLRISRFILTPCSFLVCPTAKTYTKYGSSNCCAVCIALAASQGAASRVLPLLRRRAMQRQVVYLKTWGHVEVVHPTCLGSAS